MTAAIVFLIVIALLAGAGIAVRLGLTPDTRDPDWSLGRVAQPHS